MQEPTALPTVMGRTIARTEDGQSIARAERGQERAPPMTGATERLAGEVGREDLAAQAEAPMDRMTTATPTATRAPVAKSPGVVDLEAQDPRSGKRTGSTSGRCHHELKISPSSR